MFHYIILCNICKFFFNRSRYLSIKISFINFFRNFAKFRPLSGAQVWLAIGNAILQRLCWTDRFSKNPNQFLSGSEWRTMALIYKSRIVRSTMFSSPHINPGGEKAVHRYCSMVDPSRVNVTPGFLFIKFH